MIKFLEPVVGGSLLPPKGQERQYRGQERQERGTKGSVPKQKVPNETILWPTNSWCLFFLAPVLDAWMV